MMRQKIPRLGIFKNRLIIFKNRLIIFKNRLIIFKNSLGIFWSGHVAFFEIYFIRYIGKVDFFAYLC